MPPLPADSSLPDWAVAQASAALKVGLSVPEIERLLVTKGLPPPTATSVVNAVLEGRVRASEAPLERAERSRASHRIASAVAACACLALAYAFGGGLSAARTLLWLLLPVVCIWWAEAVEPAVPPALVRLVAWIALLAIGGYRVVLLSL
jgi:hypothetical protein